VQLLLVSPAGGGVLCASSVPSPSARHPQDFLGLKLGPVQENGLPKLGQSDFSD
jgi:hypothetical protein